jgi:hypothetical protein
MSREVEPTQEELDGLPFNTTDLEVTYNKENDVRSQFVNWNNQYLQRYPSAAWEDYNRDRPLQPEDWDKHYLRTSLVNDVNYHFLEGQYWDKYVRLSRTQRAWVYRNNRPVNFDIPPDEHDPNLEQSTAGPSQLEETAEQDEPESEESSNRDTNQDTSDDEAQVTDILDCTAERITQVTASIS